MHYQLYCQFFSIDNYKPRKLQNIGLSYSFGYSKSNIGDPISFVDVNQADPPPITSRLGMTFGGNLIIYNNLGIDFKFVREAEELMVERIANENVSKGYEDIYKDGYLGDIDIQKHLLNGEGDEDVIIHKGSEVTLFKFYSIRKGKHIDLDGKVEYKTSGYGIDFGEMIKSASYIFESPSIREMKLLNYVNLKYNSSKYSAEIGRLSHTIPIEFGVHSHSHERRLKYFADEVSSSIAAYEDFFGAPPIGYRAPNGLINREGIVSLIENQFKYDASIFPSIRMDEYGYSNLHLPNKPFRFVHSGNEIIELPAACLDTIRLVFSMSYIKFLGLDIYKTLMRFFPLPDVVVLDSHPYDYYTNRIAANIATIATAINISVSVNVVFFIADA